MKNSKFSAFKQSRSVDAPLQKGRSEAGDTLVEVLIAIAILGIASVAILFAFATSITGSSEHRTLAAIDVALRSASQDAVSQVQFSAAAPYKSCAVPTDYGQVAFNNLPSGYTASITAVSYWTGSTATPTFTFSSTCAAGSTNPQLLTISVISTATHASQNVNAVVSDPTTRPVPTAGSATQLVFFEQPGNGTSGSALQPQPVIAVEDAAGNVVDSDLSTVTLTLNTVSGPSGAVLSSNCTGSEFFGIVTFSNCSVLKAGTFTVTATDASLPNASITSNQFTVSPGPASQLVFSSQPGNGTGGLALVAQPAVTVEDAGGNTVTADSSTVTLSIASGTPTSGGPGTLSGCSGAENSGVVKFSGCAINKTGANYALTASDGSLTPATSSTFTITTGPAAQLAFTTAPANATGGVTFATAPGVSVEDAGGNVVTNANNSITLGISTAPSGGGTLSCGINPRTPTAGVASFSNCKITGAAGTYTLKATASGLTPAASGTFTVAGTATTLVFTTSPSNAASGFTIATQPVVTVEDALGDVVTNDSSTVSLALSAQPSGSNTLNCGASLTKGASAGVATFSGCKITGSPGTYSLKATDGILTAATSATFTVSGTPTKLVITTQPSSSTGGAAFATQPVVTVEDALGDVVTSDGSTVKLAIATATPTSGGPGTLSGCNGTENSGVISFTGCSINTAGTGYKLTATDGTLTSATSTAFNIAVGAPSQLAFSTQPGNGTDGTTLGTQPVVSVEDSGGNVVTSATNAVTLSIASQPGSGATLTCTTNPLAAANGVSGFGGCQIVGKAGNYTLSATSAGLSSATSSSLTLSVGAATQVVFSTQPGGGANGSTWGTQPVASVEDIGGNVVTGATNSITLGIATQPVGGGTLACTTNPKAAAAGVATFAGCKITGKAGAYTLSATATGLTSATSNSFSISAGTATQVVFSTQPGGGANGAAWNTQPVVTIEDASGNVATTNTSNVTLAIASQPGSGATLNCGPNTQAAKNGAVAFTTCQISGQIGNYTLTATDGTLTSATSTAFNIAVGAPSQLAFSTQPGNGTDGTTLGTQPVVSVEDSGGNVVTSATNAVTLSIASQPGSGATLTCTTNPLAAANGVSGFGGCQIVGKAGNYTLSATSAGLSSATSSSFTLSVGAATQVVFSTQPGGGANGSTWGTQPVASVEDIGGNVVTGATNSITLGIATQPVGGGTLACTTNPKAAAAGVATFAGCKITGKAGAYTLSATATGLTSATSNSFSISAGTATQVVFSTQPGGGANGAAWNTQPVVAIEDASGNVATTNTSNVTLAIAGQPGSGATLSCANNPLGASAGVASFADARSWARPGTTRSHASANGLAGATSNSFSISAGAASQLAFSTQPGNGTDGTTLGTQPVVSVEDSGGNVVTSATNAVTLSIASQPGSGATLTCTTNPLAAANGVSGFGGCQIVGKAGNYTLSATSAGLSSATSSSFTLSVGAATQVVFSTQPGGGANGSTWGTQPVASVEDIGGNVVTGATNSITLGIATQPVGGGTLACTTNPKAAAAGVATFAGCKITGKAGAYTLSATATGLTSATSNSFSISAGTATQVVFSTQPGGGANGAAWNTQPVVAIEDASGNVATTNTSNVTLAIAGQPGSGATLSCANNPLGASAGVASFAGCQIVGKAGNYTLSASANGLAGATSNSFSISAGAASQLAFSTQPGNGTDGTTLGTQPVVSVEDSGGNVVTSATNAVTLSIASQPGSGATLTCTTNPLAAANGVSGFGGCQIVGKAGNYTLSATSAGLSSATSSSFTLSVGAATQVVFSTQPGGGANGSTWGTQPVASVEDIGGNVVTGATNSITLGIATQPVGGGTLACTTNPKAAAAGVATFAGCKITGKAGAYTLSATATGLTSATSNSFSISAGTATQVVFSTQPGGGANGAAWNTQPVVAIEDASGNVATTNTSNVTLAIAGQPGSGATLSCANNPLGASAGVASFAGCQIVGKAGNYTLERVGERARRRHLQLVLHQRRSGQPVGLQHPTGQRD